MEKLLSDRGPSLTGAIVNNLAERLEIQRLTAYPLHPQANGVVEGGSERCPGTSLVLYRQGPRTGTNMCHCQLPL